MIPPPTTTACARSGSRPALPSPARRSPTAPAAVTDDRRVWAARRDVRGQRRHGRLGRVPIRAGAGLARLALVRVRANTRRTFENWAERELLPSLRELGQLHASGQAHRRSRRSETMKAGTLRPLYN